MVQRVDGGWRAWICCHPLDEPDEEDRMTTAHATSGDGLEWEWHGTAPRRGPDGGMRERARCRRAPRRACGLRRPGDEGRELVRADGPAGPAGEPGRLIQTNEAPVSHVRYLDVLPLPGGGYRIWYEALLPGESHELRTELIQP